MLGAGLPQTTSWLPMQPHINPPSTINAWKDQKDYFNMRGQETSAVQNVGSETWSESTVIGFLPGKREIKS